MTASTRYALGSVMATVAATAGTVTTTVTAIGSAVEMGAAAITEARIKQRARHAIDRLDFMDQLVEEKAAETASRQGKIRELCQDETFKADFLTAQTKYQSVVDALNVLPAGARNTPAT